MRRGVVLLMMGVTAWFVLAGPISSAAAAPAQDDASTSTAVVDGQQTVRDDPAADRLRQVTYGLVALGALLIVGTAAFWRATRPPLLDAAVAAGAASDADPGAAVGAGATASPGSPNGIERRRTRRGAAADTGADAGAGGRIPAAAFLATPPTPLYTGAAAAGAATAVGEGAAAVVGAVGAAAVGAAAVAGTAGEDGDGLSALAPPEGSPVLDAPAPLDDIPLGAPRPLVGNDSAWIIEPERGSGLISGTPNAEDFSVPDPTGRSADDVDPRAALDSLPGADLDPAEAADPVDSVDSGDAAAPMPVIDRRATADTGEFAVIDVTGTDRSEASEPASEPVAEPDPVVEAASDPAPVAEAAPTAPPVPPSPLFAALAAIPDHEPTRIWFDDPPVERVRRRRPPTSPAPADADAGTPEATGPAAPATTAERAERRRGDAPRGAPGFDEIARQTATNPAIDVRDSQPAPRPRPEAPRPRPEAAAPQRRPDAAVDDMALMAAALSSLPQRPEAGTEIDPDLSDVPPVGVFYDQDLDPDDPPGRP